jgi:hypothetical protein
MLLAANLANQVFVKTMISFSLSDNKTGSHENDSKSISSTSILAR